MGETVSRKSLMGLVNHQPSHRDVYEVVKKRLEVILPGVDNRNSGKNLNHLVRSRNDLEGLTRQFKSPQGLASHK